MTNVVRRVVGHGMAVGAIASLCGVGPHGVLSALVSIVCLAGYFAYMAGRSLFGVLRWAKAFTAELLDFLPMAGRLPAAVRECRAKWRGVPPMEDVTPGRDGLGVDEDPKADLVGVEN